MNVPDPFRQAEDRFFALKGQLAAGRITREQFEAALKDLMFQDAQGRYWMIGADTGLWYVYDGQTWVQAPPASTPAPAGSNPPSSVPPAPYGSPAPEHLAGAAPASGRAPASGQAPTRGLGRVLVLLGILAVVLLGILALLLALRQGVFSTALASATNTPLAIVRPTVSPTLLTVAATTTTLPAVPSTTPPPAASTTPLPPATSATLPPAASTTPLPPATSATLPPTASTTPLPPAASPTVLPTLTGSTTPIIIVITATAPPATATFTSTSAPTLAPATPATPRTATLTPTVFAPQPAVPPAAVLPAVVPPTAAPPTPAVAPGLYVTGVSTEPAQVTNGQFPTFKVTFLNTLGAPANVNWYIKIFEPDKKQSFGETAKAPAQIATGTTTLASPANWKAPGAQPCRQFIARIFYVAPDNTILEFPNVEGNNFNYYFSVCP